MTMYDYREPLKAISARLRPGLIGRIDYNCQQYHDMNRNKFLNYSAEFLLQTILEVQCGNLKKEQLPSNLVRLLQEFFPKRKDH